MSSKGKTEYFGYVRDIKAPDWLIRMPARKRTVSFKLDIDQAQEIMMALSAAIAHHTRAGRQKAGGRSKLKPIDHVAVTFHIDHRMVTVLGYKAREKLGMVTQSVE